MKISIYDILDIINIDTVYNIYLDFGINEDKVKEVLISEIKSNNIAIEEILSTLEYKELKKIANDLETKERKTENIINYLKIQNINISKVIDSSYLLLEVKIAHAIFNTIIFLVNL